MKVFFCVTAGSVLLLAGVIALAFAAAPDVDSAERICDRMRVAFAAIGVDRFKVIYRTDERWALARMQVDGATYEHTVRMDGVHRLHALERLADELDARAERCAAGEGAHDALRGWEKRR